MSSTLQYVFDDLDAALAMQRWLQAHGGKNVRTSSLAEDTGAVGGNFLLEYKDGDPVRDAAAGTGGINDGLRPQPVVSASLTVLTVTLPEGACTHEFDRLLDEAGGKRLD